MEQKAIFCFGRFNPPTIGHIKQFECMYDMSQHMNAEMYIFVSSTQDNKVNPLSVELKIRHLQKLYPTVQVLQQQDPFTSMQFLIESGYNDLTYCAGSDYFTTIGDLAWANRMERFGKSLDADIVFKVQSTGQRDEQISATLAREAVLADNWVKFVQLTYPTTNYDIELNDIRDLYNSIGAAYN